MSESAFVKPWYVVEYGRLEGFDTDSESVVEPGECHFESHDLSRKEIQTGSEPSDSLAVVFLLD